MANPAPAVVLLVVVVLLPLLFSLLLWDPIAVGRSAVKIKKSAELPLRFRYDGAFKILQVADMHYGNGATTRCRDVPSAEADGCSDLNTTQFLWKLIQLEKPDLVAFTGDNIFGTSSTDAAESLFKAFGPVLQYGKPWAAVLGNHDQESTMDRFELMSLISLMDYSISQVNPFPASEKQQRIDGFGNYHISIHGAFGSALANTSVLNLYFIDSGDRAVVNGFKTYGWIKESQLTWIESTSQKIQGTFQAPALTFFHIPVPEVRQLWYSKIVGLYQEAVACSAVNSGVLKTLVSMGDVKAVFIGHDHLNDFCGKLDGIWFCYGGGFGYHGYGRANWPRRARVIFIELTKGVKEWLGVESIKTWKRIDDTKLSKIDEMVLWKNSKE